MAKAKRRTRYLGLQVSILTRSRWLQQPGNSSVERDQHYAEKTGERLVIRKLKYMEQGKVKTRTLGYCTRADAERARDLLEDQLLEEKRRGTQLALAGKMNPADRIPIVREVERRLAKLGRNAPTPTRRNQTDALQRFLTWCGTANNGKPIRFLDDLTPLRLQDFADSLHEAKRRDGKPYMVSTINQTLKHVRTMLRKIVVKLPFLTSDDLRETLKHTPIMRDQDRELHGISHATPVARTEIPKLLQAALAFDARPQRKGRSAPPVAPAIVLVLLTGMRRAEVTTRKVSDVLPKPDRPDERRLKVPGRRQGLTVGMVEYSSTGVELLDILTAGRGPDEWLSTLSYRQSDDVLRRLVPFGAPRCTWHDLRATCAQYQLSLSHVEPAFKAARMGHGVHVREKHYLEFCEDQPTSAPDLETAMGCVADFQAVIAAAKSDPRMTEPRLEPRIECGPKVRQLVVPPRMELKNLG